MLAQVGDQPLPAPDFGIPKVEHMDPDPSSPVLDDSDLELFPETEDDELEEREPLDEVWIPAIL